MQPGSRGFGYWVWKPAVIHATLRAATTDVVLFLDAGCVLNPNTEARRRFVDYVEEAADVGLLATQLDLAEQRFTKGDLLDRLGMSEVDRVAGQFQSGIVFLRRDDHSRALCEHWMALSHEDGYRYLNDSPSLVPNSPDFVEHRHDQSILSCLLKLAGTASIPDETHFKGAWESAGASYPIWAPRHTWGCSFPGDQPAGLALKIERRLLR